MTPIVLVSPFSGDIEANRRYANRCVVDCLQRGEAPFGGHLIYPQVLDDNDPEDRKKGMLAGQSFIPILRAVAVYLDRGISSGMWDDLTSALQWADVKIFFRALESENKPIAEHYTAIFDRFGHGEVRLPNAGRTIEAIRFFVEGKR